MNEIERESESERVRDDLNNLDNLDLALKIKSI